MLNFLIDWLAGTILAIIVMFILFAIGSIVILVVSALGVWTWALVFPFLIGLAFALSDF